MDTQLTTTVVVLFCCGGGGGAVQTTQLRLEYYTEAVDIWSFGVIFYQSAMRVNGLAREEWSMRVDRAFYEAKILHADESAGVAWRPQRPHFASALLDEAWLVIERCWQFDPAKRPSAAQLVSMLEDLLARY